MMMFASSLLIKEPGEISGVVESLEDLLGLLECHREIFGDIVFRSPCFAERDHLMILEIAADDLIRFLDPKIEQDLSFGPRRIFFF